MNKTTIAIFLSIMFASLTVAPDIIVLMNQDCEVSFLIDSNEEEERKGEEKVKDIEIEIPISSHIDYALNLDNEEKSLNLQPNNYSSIIKELTSPPPEINSL